MLNTNDSFDLTRLIQHIWVGQPMPPAVLLEQRVMEIELLGLIDEADDPGIPSTIRQFATASLLHWKPPYFVTFDDEFLFFREDLEYRYGLKILSVPEAVLLLRDAANGPPN